MFFFDAGRRRRSGFFWEVRIKNRSGVSTRFIIYGPYGAQASFYACLSSQLHKSFMNRAILRRTVQSVDSPNKIRITACESDGLFKNFSYSRLLASLPLTSKLGFLSTFN